MQIIGDDMYKIWLLCLVFVNGCATWESVSTHGQDIQQTGQVLVDAAPAASQIRPEIGGIILVLGGLCVMLGKLMSNSKSSKRSHK